MLTRANVNAVMSRYMLLTFNEGFITYPAHYQCDVWNCFHSTNVTSLNGCLLLAFIPKTTYFEHLNYVQSRHNTCFDGEELQHRFVL